jgi:hypothetical protein
MSGYNKTCMDDLSIAVPIFEGAEEQDVVGPSSTSLSLR